MAALELSLLANYLPFIFSPTRQEMNMELQSISASDRRDARWKTADVIRHKDLKGKHRCLFLLLKSYPRKFLGDSQD